MTATIGLMLAGSTVVAIVSPQPLKPDVYNPGANGMFQVSSEQAGVLGPLGANAPNQLIVLEPLQGNTLTLEDRKLEVIGLYGASPDRTFV